MLQRHLPGWSRDGERRRPRLLIEDPTGELAAADLSVFEQAGFEVAHCAGPDADADCDLLAAGACDLADRADVVLFGLEGSSERHREVLRAMRARHPGTPVLVRLPRRGAVEGELPRACKAIAFATSASGLGRALSAALAASASVADSGRAGRPARLR